MTNKENFEIIYKEYAPAIRKLCLSYTGDRDNAEDLIQETYLHYCMEKTRQFSQRCQIKHLDLQNSDQ
ncbi:RNA polymerase sigma factor [Sphingobacterium sp. 18053]|uniref:RNA polymerase sigma factor n=1 Tax=Sphingobacterium sp. 18053 TaxID=2681401 RepID=UPI001F4251CD|nr:sigma factor [Sphingobacterium sp. 18053]